MLKYFTSLIRSRTLSTLTHPLRSSFINSWSPAITVTQFSTTPSLLAMNLKNVIKEVETIAPISSAEEWDNVGLLLEPSRVKPITHILLTNDLTEAVMDEVLELKRNGEEVGLIISYHPPIFRPFKRLTQSSAKDRIIIKALEHEIAVYSPHTAHDTLWGGVNDWVLSGFKDKGAITPLSVKQVSDGGGSVLKVGGVSNKDELEKVVMFLKAEGAKECLIQEYKTPNSTELSSVQCRVRDAVLTKLIPSITEQHEHLDITISADDKVPIPGAGRLITFEHRVSIDSLIAQIKAHLNIKHVRLALPSGLTEEYKVTTLAVCVGSGASVLKGASAEVYLTGEMSHHEVLDATSKGVVCVLCEHSNTERGFLKVFKNMLQEKLDSVADVKILISQADKDPFTYY